MLEMSMQKYESEVITKLNSGLPRFGKAYWDSPITLSQAAKPYHVPERMTSPYENNPIDITLFVSCYNEEQFIINTLNTIVLAMEKIDKTYEILVIDDCSKDRSLALIQEFIAQHPEVPIILRANVKNKGLAQNFVDGAFLGQGKYYRLFCGDNSETVETMIT